VEDANIVGSKDSVQFIILNKLLFLISLFNLIKIDKFIILSTTIKAGSDRLSDPVFGFLGVFVAHDSYRLCKS